jgi:ferric-dicitrate binding protein FerR (iron transport regulator)
MSQFTQPEEWSILLNALADDELTSEQERRLIELMQADVEFRREYVRFCQLLTQLHWQHDIEPDALPASDNLMAPVRSSRSKRHWWQASLALVLLLTVVVGWLNWNEPVEEAP